MVDIEYVAKLARIDLAAKEKKKLTQQLGDILAYIEKLKQLNVDQIEPMSHVLPLKNVFRKDQVKPSLPADQALSNAPSQRNSSFSVPRIIE
ncbi:MAG: Asp-tRNA(Asn)/Glu-tRNA(Gln) amidotransferase subunit GatC [Candidatus Omnitrophica bacterium]|nr:Asp-tRNA(Asn)/Glu-tRNA(Gln) amidotransferase subunit GatC [Candidatus Omnitrophota bacterium]